MPPKPRKPKSSVLRLAWRHARLEITYTPDYLAKGQDHIEVQVKAPKGAPIPITATGYRSEFASREAVQEAGGPVGYVAAWLDREAKSKDWERAEFKWRQLEFELLPPTSARRPAARQSAPIRRRRAGQGSQ